MDAPFWQGPADAQPWFLRATQLEADGRWRQLAELSARWTAADASDANAWLARGKAELELREPAAAVKSLDQSVKLDASNADAWYVLGRAYAALGRTADTMDCYRRLMALAEDRGLRLARDAGLCGREPAVRC
jgi:tetratricopeptide (TPR) repeat protein